MKRLTLSLLLSGILVYSLSTSLVSAASSGEGNFQIMKATGEKLWRLDKTTGEISVCSLDGDRLICTSSNEAMRPPELTYEQRQAEKKRMGKEKNAQEMEFLDRALNAIRTLFEASLDSKSEPAQ